MVIFSEAVTGVEMDDFVPYVSGTITGATVENVKGGGDIYTVTINRGPGDGTLRLDIPASATITDLDGNPLTNQPFTSGATYTIQEAAGGGTYDDADPHWAYTGSWMTSTGTGPLDNTWHTSNTVNSAAQFTSEGVQFKLTYVKASQRGLLAVYVDGDKITTLNAASSRLVWQATWTSPSLTPGAHTVRVVHASGAYIDIDAITLYGIPPPVDAGIYEDTAAAWIYSSDWTTQVNGMSSTSHYTNVVGGNAQISFVGARFILNYSSGSNYGLIDVYVDGVKIVTLDSYAATATSYRDWTSPAFPLGFHTVRFVHAGGGTYIDADAITIVP